MISFLMLLMVVISPTLLIILIAFPHFGLTWHLLLIPVGAVAGFIIMVIVGAYFSGLIIWLNDQQTGPPEPGSIGAGVSRTILGFMSMALFGWIGSGFGALSIMIAIFKLFHHTV